MLSSALIGRAEQISPLSLAQPCWGFVRALQLWHCRGWKPVRSHFFFFVGLCRQRSWRQSFNLLSAARLLTFPPSHQTPVKPISRQRNCSVTDQSRNSKSDVLRLRTFIFPSPRLSGINWRAFWKHRNGKYCCCTSAQALHKRSSPHTLFMRSQLVRFSFLILDGNLLRHIWAEQLWLLSPFKNFISDPNKSRSLGRKWRTNRTEIRRRQRRFNPNIFHHTEFHVCLTPAGVRLLHVSPPTPTSKIRIRIWNHSFDARVRSHSSVALKLKLGSVCFTDALI